MKGVKNFFIVLGIVLTIILLLFVFAKQTLIQLVEKTEEIKRKNLYFMERKINAFFRWNF